jgi:hypothetical protein
MTHNTIPLPEPVALVVQKVIRGRKGAPDTYKYDFVLCDSTLRPCKLYTADQMHTHAAKVCAEKDAEIVNLHTVMMAAAVEITEHWDAHCDGEGYGPANLVRRLENGFPEQYGYDAQTLVRVEKQLAERNAEIERLRAVNLNMTQAIMDTYGILWNINTEPMAPTPLIDPEKAAAKARLILKEMLCHEQLGIAINAARAALKETK